MLDPKAIRAMMDYHRDKMSGGSHDGEDDYGHGDEMSPEEEEYYLGMLVEECAEIIDAGGGDDEIMALMEDYDPGDNPSWVEDESLWAKAVEAVMPDDSDYADPWAVVAHVYKKLGGGIRSAD